MIETTEILNEIETSKIISFTADKIMFEAVKKYLLVYLYQQGVGISGKAHDGTKNWALQLVFNAITPASHGGIYRTNEELGTDLRAVAKGIQIIESGFKELLEIKQPVVTDEKSDNPAL